MSATTIIGGVSLAGAIAWAAATQVGNAGEDLTADAAYVAQATETEAIAAACLVNDPEPCSVDDLVATRQVRLSGRYAFAISTNDTGDPVVTSTNPETGDVLSYDAWGGGFVGGFDPEGRLRGFPRYDVEALIDAQDAEVAQ